MDYKTFKFLEMFFNEMLEMQKNITQLESLFLAICAVMDNLTYDSEKVKAVQNLIEASGITRKE